MLALDKSLSFACHFHSVDSFWWWDSLIRQIEMRFCAFFISLFTYQVVLVLLLIDEIEILLDW